MAKKPTSNTDAESSSALQKKTAQIASKETATEKFRKASLTNPRFVELKTSGKSFGIVGARPPTKVAMSGFTMSEQEMKQQFENRRAEFGPNIVDFMLKYGRAYQPGPNTYSGGHSSWISCFAKCTHLAHRDGKVIYCEGYVFVWGAPLEHAWVLDKDGNVIDPDITDNDDGRVSGYFGMPFDIDYVVKVNRLKGSRYGVLDYSHAGKTVTKLCELGLEAGQQWLLAPRKMPKPPPGVEIDRDGSEQWLKRMDPRRANFLCTLEGSTKYSYYLQLGRAHWMLWLKMYDDNWGKWETPIVTARFPLKGFHGSAGDAAIILLTASLVDDKRTFGHNSMGINDTGLLSMDELHALLDTVWGVEEC